MEHKNKKAMTIAFWIMLMPFGLIFYYRAGLIDLPFIFLFIIVSNILCFLGGAYAQYLDDKNEKNEVI